MIHLSKEREASKAFPQKTRKETLRVEMIGIEPHKAMDMVVYIQTLLISKLSLVSITGQIHEEMNQLYYHLLSHNFSTSLPLSQASPPDRQESLQLPDSLYRNKTHGSGDVLRAALPVLVEKSILNALPQTTLPDSSLIALSALGTSVKSACANPLGCPVLRSIATLTSITFLISRNRLFRSRSLMSKDMFPMKRVLVGAFRVRSGE